MVGVIVADQAQELVARSRDGTRTVGGDDVDIKLHQAVGREMCRMRAHPVGRVADRAGEAVVNVP